MTERMLSGSFGSDRMRIGKALAKKYGIYALSMHFVDGPQVAYAENAHCVDVACETNSSNDRRTEEINKD